MKTKCYGKNAVKIGDILFGLRVANYEGYPDFKEIKIDKIGSKYFYSNNRKLNIGFDTKIYPQHGERVAYDPEYEYYRSVKEVKESNKIRQSAIKLNKLNFLTLSAREVRNVAAFLGISDEFEEEADIG
ncbi:hypothetical protein CKN63_12450 [Carnobacterium divergens]|uniref:hypothetical protein n=1 Tax=Carnobacterium divergens TaxID=2748 RepID=UPI001072570B|nr:hypothetical protein [Carnobacterium divergens]TFI61432.1 hypothetical protein CKN59_12875 [Carnobacterium divergens]TFI61710.1 hypothetical protein CKN76_12490 [Carnobacterium divergens]TFI77009.1 hypothetical protein CKN74_13105 [Carnobacterium divergens]TFJ00124.1 hypothetical protein CKN75_13535 [Carnobacterium divergens]TFJ08612.1 hypothetical protein CKN71_13310 [Carnobacterium divergens]